MVSWEKREVGHVLWEVVGVLCSVAVRWEMVLSATQQVLVPYS